MSFSKLPDYNYAFQNFVCVIKKFSANLIEEIVIYTNAIKFRMPKRYNERMKA